MIGLVALFIASAAVVVAETIVAVALPSRGSVAFALAIALLAQTIVVTTVGLAAVRGLWGGLPAKTPVPARSLTRRVR